MARRWRRLSRTTKATRTGGMRHGRQRLRRRTGTRKSAQQLPGMGHRAAAARQRTHLGAPFVPEPGAHAQCVHHALHQLHHRPAQFDREVQARQFAAPVAQVDAVVDDVDAADEGHLVVDDAQLLVQAPQLARLQPGQTSDRAGGTRPARCRRPPASPSVAAAWPWSRSRRPPRAPPRRAAPRRAAPRPWRGRPRRHGRCRWPARPATGAPAMAPCMAGKSSSPPCSRRTRLPPTNPASGSACQAHSGEASSLAARGHGSSRPGLRRRSRARR